MGWASCHWCQLKVKTSLEPAFSRLPRTSFPVSDWECPSLRLRLRNLWHHQELHFQPEAGNEILKGFWLKLTPMAT
ncbi:MAG: hypothetical protein HWQ23_05485 [Nostoc sp. JL33]|nr:hypothetical protein [Nostoc sp. JL33]